MKINTNVYFDGFNFYYGCVKGTPYRWLNLSKLCTILLPGHSINHIRYFTASVKPTSDDPQKLQRQLTYFRALKTIPNLSIHYGQFLTHVVRRPLVSPKNGSIVRMVNVLDTKEKGSDVNLATYLLCDGFKREYEMAIIVTNDSDLVEPIRLVKSDLGLKTGILHPNNRYVTALSQVTEFYRPIREKALKNCLFPDSITDDNGTITKPESW